MTFSECWSLEELVTFDTAHVFVQRGGRPRRPWLSAREQTRQFEGRSGYCVVSIATHDGLPR
jgi:hypothetical protein